MNRISPELVHLEWNKFDGTYRQTHLTYDGIFGDPESRFNAIYAMSDYIDWLREELAYRDHLQGQTREFLGIDKREVLM